MSDLAWAGASGAGGDVITVCFEDAHKTNVNAGDRLTNITGLNGQKEGYYAKAAYMLPGTVGAEGKIQPYVLYEDWTFAHLLGINDQTIKQVGGGLNYYIHGQKARLTAEYLDTDFGTATGFVGARVDPTTFAPLDKIKNYMGSSLRRAPCLSMTIRHLIAVGCVAARLTKAVAGKARTIAELAARYDSSSCVECHQQVHDEWAQSLHARSIFGTGRTAATFKTTIHNGLMEWPASGVKTPKGRQGPAPHGVCHVSPPATDRSDR